jgi:hypothetical protein
VVAARPAKTLPKKDRRRIENLLEGVFALLKADHYRNRLKTIALSGKERSLTAALRQNNFSTAGIVIKVVSFLVVYCRFWLSERSSGNYSFWKVEGNEL